MKNSNVVGSDDSLHQLAIDNNNDNKDNNNNNNNLFRVDSESAMMNESTLSTIDEDERFHNDEEQNNNMNMNMGSSSGSLDDLESVSVIIPHSLSSFTNNSNHRQHVDNDNSSSNMEEVLIEDYNVSYSPPTLNPPTPISPSNSSYSLNKFSHHHHIKKQQSTSLQAILNEYTSSGSSTLTSRQKPHHQQATVPPGAAASHQQQLHVDEPIVAHSDDDEQNPSSPLSFSTQPNTHFHRTSLSLHFEDPDDDSDFSHAPEEEYLDNQSKYVHEIASIKGLRHQFYLEVLFWLCVVASAGSLLVCCRWLKWLKSYMTYSYSSNNGHSFADASKVLIKAKETNQWTIVKIKKGFVRNFDSDLRVSFEPIMVRYFVYRFLVFIYDPVTDSFHRVRFNTCIPFSKIHKMAEKEAENERELRELLFGKNSTEIPMKSGVQILLDEILHPFYLFQVFILVLWFLEQYYTYCISIAIVTLIVISFSFWRTYDNLKKLKDLTSNHCFVNRLALRAPSKYNRTIYSEENASKRNEEEEEMDSLDLFPGDIIEITDGMTLPCDVILLGGQVIVNESKLTGDSIPVKKRPLPYDDAKLYYPSRENNHTIFSGTQVLTAKPSPNSLFANKCFGIVSQTGFNTLKGKLLLSILFPKTAEFNVYRDSLKFLIVLVVTGFIGIIGTAANLFKLGAPAGNVFLHILDIITISVPPTLPLAMTTTITFTMRRLGKRKILCTSPLRVNLPGYVKIAVFDKTNTITENEIDVHGIFPSVEGLFHPYVKGTNISKLFASNSTLVQCLACCNNLSRVGTTFIGDPLDSKLFQTSKWSMQDISESAYGHTIFFESTDQKVEKSYSKLNVFDFKSSVQRMSVVIKNNATGNLHAFAKGSAESVKSISKPSSIPPNYSDMLKCYAQKGYRVMALASKTLPSNLTLSELETLPREYVESEMEFIGLLLVENKVKKGTSKSIKTLLDCNIKCIICSGDNAYTSINVARKSKVIEKKKDCYLSELKREIVSNVDYIQNIMWRQTESGQVITTEELLKLRNIDIVVVGEVFEYVHNEHRLFVKKTRREPYINTKRPSLLHIILTSCNIYARFSPNHKKTLVTELQKMGYDVGMIGDGANDLGALRSAHVGISLSEEISVAAPFTSLKPTVGSMVTVIREGRASLLTFFQIFKFIALYSIVQIMTIVVLLSRNCNFVDFQFLFIDLIVVMPTTLLMTRTDASLALKREKPPTTLISRFIFLSLGGHVLLASAFIFHVWTEIMREPWFSPTINTNFMYYKNDLLRSYETTIMFFVCTFCIINISICMSISKPFKLPIITNNFTFTLFIIIIYLATAYLLFIPTDLLKQAISLINFPLYYKLRIVIYSLSHLAIGYCFEMLLIVSPTRRLIKRFTVLNIALLTRRILRAFSIPVSSWIVGLIENEQTKLKVYKQLAMFKQTQ
ncbi:cation translocating P-type ATPase [Naegleria gruberi]|uniref:Cation translocating P-type ATPase n=1 Tax=Naegleria gruberi TaxID=5762 RepID=D2VZW0_NAEGR|nr:cation translocating P-type ATPase [Naegleria gruberi]EFC37639.1 cation translocating P-type ATPase [Naegleria gruberi]|eukprot:XP_002670383.1 cation translocating P-type ATPase [Naegleria gruberi strain NEG-M]